MGYLCVCSRVMLRSLERWARPATAEDIAVAKLVNKYLPGGLLGTELKKNGERDLLGESSPISVYP